MSGFSLRGTLGAPSDAAGVILKSMFNVDVTALDASRGMELKEVEGGKEGGKEGGRGEWREEWREEGREEGREEANKDLDTEVRVIEAREEMRGSLPAYVFEYTLKRPQMGLNQHTVCVIIARDNELFTLSTMSPAKEWGNEKDKIMTIANSFVVQDN